MLVCGNPEREEANAEVMLLSDGFLMKKIYCSRQVAAKIKERYCFRVRFC